MTASIRFNGNAGPLQVTADTSVTCTNFNNTGVAGWSWSLDDKPEGSSAALTNPNASTPSFVADLEGTYLVRLRTYKNASKTIADGADSQAVFIRFATAPTWRLPAAGETTEIDQQRGWASETNRIFSDLHGSAGGSVRDSARFVVGSEGKGHVLGKDCDFLDPGDGSAIAAAILAASDYGCGGVIQLLSMVVDLEEGDVATPMNIPSGWALEGSGRSTSLRTRSGADGTKQEMFSLADNAMVRSLKIVFAPPNDDVLSSNAIIEVNGANCVIDNTLIEFAGNGAGAINISGLIRDASPNGLLIRDLTVDASVITAFGTYAIVLGTESSGGKTPATAMPPTVRGLKLIGQVSGIRCNNLTNGAFLKDVTHLQANVSTISIEINDDTFAYGIAPMIEGLTVLYKQSGSASINANAVGLQVDSAASGGVLHGLRITNATIMRNDNTDGDGTIRGIVIFNSVDTFSVAGTKLSNIHGNALNQLVRVEATPTTSQIIRDTFGENIVLLNPYGTNGSAVYLYGNGGNIIYGKWAGISQILRMESAGSGAVQQQVAMGCVGVELKSDGVTNNVIAACSNIDNQSAGFNEIVHSIP